MSGTGLDYGTGRRIREFIRLNMASPPTVQQVMVRFRLRPGDEPDVRDLMTEVALIGRLASPAPEVRTPPAEVLDILLSAVAAAPTRVHANLMSCKFCRNRLLYVLDTAPYAGNSLTASQAITARLRALPDNHELHQPGSGDSKPPQIRWITP